MTHTIPVSGVHMIILQIMEEANDELLVNFAQPRFFLLAECQIVQDEFLDVDGIP